jgi:YHS domain-containing protein
MLTHDLELEKEQTMDNNKRRLGKVLVVAGVMLAALLFTQGCKDESAAQQAAGGAHTHDHTGDHDHEHPEAQVVAAAEKTAEDAAETVSNAIEQKTCPVMAGNPINKALFVEYEGKKVYFCCKGCEDKFLADPAQYVAKLPQFQN